MSFAKVINNFNGIFFWTIDSPNSDAQYSENILSVTGFNNTEILKLENAWSSLILKDDIAGYKKKLADFEKDNKKDYFELNYRITRKDGEIAFINEKIKVIRKSDGKIKKKFGIVSDVTGYIKEAEELKVKKEELEQLNSSKDNFISILSHDLRAPFTSILGFAEIIRNESKLSESDRAEYIKYIYDSSQNQLQLINHLFDWSQLQTGRLNLEIQRLNALSITYNCVSYLTELAIRKNIKINVKVPEVFHIDADEKMITKGLTNLISNAVKYSPVNEIVEISANIYNKDFIEFVIRDRGVGIPEANIEKIFNIGKIFSTEGTKGERGSGLGLMLAKQIVEKHGGEIWFFSSEGKGSEFHFTIPAAASAVLLVIEDKKKLSDLESNIRQNFSNLNVIKAENAFEALEIIAAKLPSLIIIEHNLPLMDGLQFINTLRENNKFIQIPLITFIYSDGESVFKSYQGLGVKVIKQEPFFTAQLEDKIKSLLFI